MGELGETYGVKASDQSERAAVGSFDRLAFAVGHATLDQGGLGQAAYFRDIRARAGIRRQRLRSYGQSIHR